MPLSIPRVVPTCMQQCSCTCCSGMPYLCVHVLSSTACRCTCLKTPYSFVFTSMNCYRYATNIYKHMQWEGPVQHSSHSRPQGATDDQSTTVITCHNIFCKDPEILMWVTQCCSSWGPGVETRLPLAVGTCTLGLRTQMGASSSLIRANSLLSNLSARRARMVAPAPWPGSCSSGDSCLMVVNTNCSVDAKRERPRRERTAHTHTRQQVSTHRLYLTQHIHVSVTTQMICLLCAFHRKHQKLRWDSCQHMMDASLNSCSEIALTKPLIACPGVPPPGYFM